MSNGALSIRENPPASGSIVCVASRVLEADLLRRALSGESEAYGGIFSLHQRSAYSLALYYTRNREDALDVVQDAFIKAYQNLGRFDLERSFGPWLLSIVRNLSIDLLRKRRFSSHELLTESLQDKGAHRRAEGRLLKREVWSGMARLDAKHREIILLKDYLGYAYLEIADMLGIPLGTVMSRLHQARKRLKRILRDRFRVRTATPLPN